MYALNVRNEENEHIEILVFPTESQAQEYFKNLSEEEKEYCQLTKYYQNNYYNAIKTTYRVGLRDFNFLNYAKQFTQWQYSCPLHYTNVLKPNFFNDVNEIVKKGDIIISNCRDATMLLVVAKVDKTLKQVEVGLLNKYVYTSTQRD